METLPHYSSGIVLNDAIFLQYGGQTGTSLNVQRNAAYWLAESQMVSYLGTFLRLEVVTGTIPYFQANKIVSTEMGYVQRFLNFRVLNSQKQELWTVSGTSLDFWIGEDTFGYIRYIDLPSKDVCRTNPTGTPAYFEYVYEAGLPPEIATCPSMLLALTMAAQISLNEMVFPFSNESTGDVGVIEYRSLQYSERRKMWKNTAFGASPKAAKIAQLVDSTVIKARKGFSLR